MVHRHSAYFALKAAFVFGVSIFAFGDERVLLLNVGMMSLAVTAVVFAVESLVRQR